MNELGKKISTAGSNTVKAVSDMSQISKLKDSITDEQRRINSYYVQIGQQFFEKHPDAQEEPFLSICSYIKNSITLIENYERDIRAIQDIKICPECGAECKFSSIFCPSCGVPFQNVEPENLAPGYRCSNCGASLQEGALFCTECGQHVEQADPAAPRCINCGAVLQEDARFCSECGHVAA
ncbi:MAG: zinc ribbon domain-containing protein [Clostridiales Family XIII bacterium]|nr:zinc ribbon domain-containing protein [Clostridiales Family XIII bacterium]